MKKILLILLAICSLNANGKIVQIPLIKNKIALQNSENALINDKLSEKSWEYLNDFLLSDYIYEEKEYCQEFRSNLENFVKLEIKDVIFDKIFTYDNEDSSLDFILKYQLNFDYFAYVKTISFLEYKFKELGLNKKSFLISNLEFTKILKNQASLNEEIFQKKDNSYFVYIFKQNKNDYIVDIYEIPSYSRLILNDRDIFMNYFKSSADNCIFLNLSNYGIRFSYDEVQSGEWSGDWNNIDNLAQSFKNYNVLIGSFSNKFHNLTNSVEENNNIVFYPYFQQDYDDKFNVNKASSDMKNIQGEFNLQIRIYEIGEHLHFGIGLHLIKAHGNGY